jgi:hypothetical protein
MSNVATVPTQPRAHLAMHREGNTITPAFETMGQVMDFAKAMAASNIGVRKHLRDNAGACMAITLQAQRWSMDPFMVANKSYLVNDQIAYESQLIAAVVNTRAPIKGRLKVRYEGAGDKRKCFVRARFVDEDEDTEVESPEFGRITPKNSPLWKSDPDQQLAYYTQRLFARRHCPEVLLGVYAEDELAQPAPAKPPGPDHAKDVTPPRPQRSDYKPQAAPTVVDVQPEPEQHDEPDTSPAFTLITADGEMLTWDDAVDAEDVVAEFAKELKAGGMHVWTANAELRDALINAGCRLPDAPGLV